MFDSSNDSVLVTGAAGFIGAALSCFLLKNGFKVIGVDNLNNYYDISLKKTRLKNIQKFSNFKNNSGWNFHEINIENLDNLENIFSKNNPKIVVHLAAQAGVRYSIKNPFSYINSNLLGFANLLELCRKYSTRNLIIASSSSVYGGNKKTPYFENQEVNHPLSLYAATKKSNELMAHSYSSLYNLPITCLRFFTVYGPWGRPDMAPMIFAKSILDKNPIKIFNYGKMKRDFTYIDDVVESIYRCCKKPALPNNKFDSFNPDQSSSFAPFRIFNVGNSNSINLLEFIEKLEKSLGIEAIKEFYPLQPGDVVSTYSDTTLLKEWIGFSPKTSINDGIKFFAEWFIEYYKKPK